MSDSPPAEPRAAGSAGTGLRTAAHLLASSIVGVPLIVLLLTQALLFQLNPRGLDLADPAAYEVEVWIPCAIVAAGLIVAVAVVFSRLGAVDRSALRYPSLMLQLQVGFAMAAVALLLLTPGF